MIVEKTFFSEDWARGFAEGLEHVNDGAISDVEVRRVDAGREVTWVVSFEDTDETREEEEEFKRQVLGANQNKEP